MNVLILSDSDSGYEKVAKAVCRETAARVLRANSYPEANNMLTSSPLDALIIAGVTDVQSLFVLRGSALKHNTAVILLQDTADNKCGYELEEMDVIAIKPQDAPVVLGYVLKTLSVDKKKISGLLNKNTDLLKKIDDIKLVNRAKLVLIQNLGYTEKQAHRHMENQAMNLKITLRAVAMNILKTYEM